MGMNFKCKFIREAPLKSLWGAFFSPWVSNLTPKLVFLSPRGSEAIFITTHYHLQGGIGWEWKFNKESEHFMIN